MSTPHAPTGSPLPFADLTPDAVLNAVEALGLVADGRLMALNSYENRVFMVGLDGGDSVIAKFYRPGRWTDEQILEEHQFAHDLQADEVPVVAPLALSAQHPEARVVGAHQSLGHVAGHRIAISPRRGGRAPELDDPEVLRWLGRFLARLHQTGAQGRFEHRLTLNPDTLGQSAIDHLQNSDDALPLGVRQRWLDAATEALAQAREAFDRQGPVRQVRLHGDMHPGNLLWTPEGPHFVDLDDARMGPAVQDLWMLLPGDRDERRPMMDALMDGYESLAEFDWHTLALIEPLRTLRMLHHSAWLARRWADPAFPAAFPWFGTEAYWLQQVELLNQQTLVMREG